MAGKASRESLMQEISKVDQEINSLIGQMPKPTSHQANQFPRLLWLVGLAGAGLWFVSEKRGLLPQIKDYALWILIGGCAFAVIALAQTFRWIGGKFSKGAGQHYRAMSEKVGELQKRRALLQKELDRAGG